MQEELPVIYGLLYSQSLRAGNKTPTTPIPPRVRATSGNGGQVRLADGKLIALERHGSLPLARDAS
jgi:hypothetical protein